ncbi:hypothetical protein TNCV_4925911 [Trichonephila clavipes]|nr:hypothetical protein TNCV_4925911 [Trichonephila clavipes]
MQGLSGQSFIPTNLGRVEEEEMISPAQEDASYERDAGKPKSTRAQYVTYPAKKQAKEEVAFVGLNRSLEQSSQHVSVHYPAER